MGFDVERITCGAFSSSSKGASSRLHSPLLVQRSGAPLQDLSKTTGWRSSCWLALSREHAFDHRLEVESPCRDSKGGGFSGTALGRRPQNRTKGADPRTGTLKGEKWFCPGVLSSLCPGLPCRGFPGSGSLLLRSCPAGPVCSLFRLLSLSFGRGRHVPAPGGRDVGSSLFSFFSGDRPQGPFSSREETLLPARRQNPPELPLRLMRRWP